MNSSPSRVVLRNLRDADGLRRLEAFITPGGDLVIEGYDFGDGVERIFGLREYEWAWTIRAPYVPDLLTALEATENVLSALEKRFAGDRAADLGPFLESHGIPHDRWSRMGD